MKTLQNEKGFAIAPILLAIALIGIIAGAIAVASRTASVSTAEHTAKITASTVIQQVSNLKTGYDIMLSKALHPTQITWDNTANTGIFHPVDGGTTEQIPPSEALVNPSGNPGYIYKVDANRNAVVRIRGIGIDNNPDYVVVLTGVKRAVCEQINRILRGVSTPPVGNGTLTQWSTAATSIDMSANTNVDRLAAACIRTTDTTESYVFYAVLKEQ